MLRVHWHRRAQTFKCFNSAADEPTGAASARSEIFQEECYESA